MKAFKTAITHPFRRASTVEVIQTLEGPVTAQPGDAILTGVNQETWPIMAPIFVKTYDINEVAGTCTKKLIAVEAERMTESFEVVVGWASEPIKGKAGDYRVTYGPGDIGCVAADIFAETYVILPE